MNLPDHSTLNRFHNGLTKEDLVDELHQQINQQFAQNQFKVEKAQTAIVGASIIQTAGEKLKNLFKSMMIEKPSKHHLKAT